MRGTAFLVLFVGCYDPSPRAGAPCSASSTCPATLVCTGGYCLLPGVGVDALQDDAPIVPPDGAIDAMVGMGWAAPVAITMLNTSQRDSDPSLTADGLELYFSSSRAGGAGGDDIYYTTRATLTSAWDAPTNLLAINSASGDLSVEVSGDGKLMWFVSNRTGMGDIYVSTRDLLGWTVPTAVTELNTAMSEADFGVAPDGLTVILSRGALGSRALYIASRASIADPFSTPTLLAAINSAANDPSAPSLSNGANTVYFHADPTRNIYVSTKIGNTYSAPLPVTEVNTASRDACPFVPQAGNVMFFERTGDLYYTSR